MGRKRNPITGELEPNRLSAGCGGADFFSLDDERLRRGTGSTISRVSRGSLSTRRTGSCTGSRCGTSKRLSTAGSYASNSSSILSAQLEEEKRLREAAEKEVAELKRLLDP